MMDTEQLRRLRMAAIVLMSWLVLGSCASASTETAQVLAAPAPAPSVQPSAATSPALPQAQSKSLISLSRTKVANGAVTIVRLGRPNGVSCDDLNADLSENVFAMFEENVKGQPECHAIIAVPFQHKPGLVPVVIKGRDGKKISEIPLLIFEGKYKSEKLKVDPNQVNPAEDDLARIHKEAAEIGKLYDRVTRKKYWKNKLLLPLKEFHITSTYGNKRVYNGELQSFHQGIDLKAKMNTPVLAIAPGEVVLAKNLYFTGWTVIIDHGYGLFSVYAHMNKLKVKRGKIVRAHSLLGLSGMTGRSSGPHLHLGTVISHVKVNPVELIKVLR
jgi:murein DD-endopeptidase MepM/ murein hydrolase activator NlpD